MTHNSISSEALLQNSLKQSGDSPLKISLPEKEQDLKPRILVVGVGGGGCNAINNMVDAKLKGVEFIAANTDAQALSSCKADYCIQLGPELTKGLGAGSKPDVGRAAAEEVEEQIKKHIAGSHMAFITAGMGGGTGTGAAPVFARIARDLGLLNVAIVTKPFDFEGRHRLYLAEQGLEEIHPYVDTLVVVPNQNLFRVAQKDTSFCEAFAMADKVLYNGIKNVSSLMVNPGIVNLDFADVRSVMEHMGKARIGTGEAEGETRAIQAVERAISNPLLADSTMKGSRSVLVNITGGRAKLMEVQEIVNRVRQECGSNAHLVFGTGEDESLGNKIRVSLIAAGLEDPLDNSMESQGDQIGDQEGNQTGEPQNAQEGDQGSQSHREGGFSKLFAKLKGIATNGAAKGDSGDDSGRDSGGEDAPVETAGETSGETTGETSVETSGSIQAGIAETSLEDTSGDGDGDTATAHLVEKLEGDETPQETLKEETSEEPKTETKVETPMENKADTEPEAKPEAKTETGGDETILSPTDLSSIGDPIEDSEEAPKEASEESSEEELGQTPKGFSPDFGKQTPKESKGIAKETSNGIGKETGNGKANGGVHPAAIKSDVDLEIPAFLRRGIN